MRRLVELLNCNSRECAVASMRLFALVRSTTRRRRGASNAMSQMSCVPTAKTAQLNYSLMRAKLAMRAAVVLWQLYSQLLDAPK